MNKQIEDTSSPPEQYELTQRQGYNFLLTRRSFFQVMGSGLAVTFSIGDSLAKSLDETFKDAEDQISAWIHVSETGTVSVYTGKAEVGQNIRTALTQIVAEELDVSLDKIEMVMGDTALTPYDQGTFGSRSVPYMGPQLRKAAANAREYLIELAGVHWKTGREFLKLEKGSIINEKNKLSIDIGALTKGKKIVRGINENVKVKPADQWKVAGKPVLKVNGTSFLTGKHKYVSDMTLPGMLYGKILRAPSYKAELVTVDTSGAKRLADVTVVHDGNFVGVAAPTLKQAMDALMAIRAEWRTVSQPSRSEIFKHLKSKASAGTGRNDHASGDLPDGLARADVKVEQTFHIDYIAHAPLEPRAGVAQWTGSKLTVWTGTQRPFGVQEELENIFHIPKEDIRVIMPDTGSGYGGKHTGEAGIEAARLAKSTGTPVKVVWTREEEFTWAYFRPAGVIDVRAGVNKDGKLTAWEFHNYNSGGSGIETPYVVSAQKIQFHSSDSPLRQGSYRGLAGPANAFARECIMNDLALSLNMDPLAFRLQNLKEERMKNVLEAAAQKFGWSTFKPSPNRGVGIACADEKGSFIATCAEVTYDPDSGDIRVVRVAASFECGAIINPNHLENQILGSLIQGMGGALFERINFENGKILNPRFSEYRVPRFGDCPKIDIVMLNRLDIPSAGAGETPIMAIAPAIRNAIDHATGKKLYTLPLVPNGLPG